MKKVALIALLLFALPLIAQDMTGDHFGFTLDPGHGRIVHLGQTARVGSYEITSDAPMLVAFFTRSEFDAFRRLRTSDIPRIAGPCIWKNIIDLRVSCASDEKEFLVFLDSRNADKQAKDALAAIFAKSQTSADRLTSPNAVRVKHVQN